jgi:hypothetical protein
MKTKNKPTAIRFLPRATLTGAALMLLLVSLPDGLALRQIARADEVHGDAIGGGPITPTPTNTAPAAVAGDKITNAAPAPTPMPSIPSSLAAAQPASAPPKVDGCLSVGFDQLASFDYSPPDTQVTNNVKPDIEDKLIPTEVKALDGKKVVIRGFMLPLRVEGDKATEFLILRSQTTCCFGVAPKINEFVNVKTVGKEGLTASMDAPLNIEGTLHVGTTRDNGYIIEIYKLDAEKLVPDAVN